MTRKFTFILLFLPALLSAQPQEDTLGMAEWLAVQQHLIDSVEQSFTYQTGTIDLNNGTATLDVPSGYRYLEPVQAKMVLEEYWGNPPSPTLGLLIPVDGGVMQEDSWAFEVSWEEMGYVEDDDAEDMDYDELLQELKTEALAANAERKSMGYPGMEMVAWAATPFYDKENKVLHWAKELHFDSTEVNTLNYNIRILGRKGVMVVNAIGTIDQLPLIQPQIEAMRTSVKFTEGNRYEDFDSSMDDVAAYTVGGLVAGKVLAKVGLFAGLAKFGKIIVVGLIAAGAWVWRFLSGRRRKKDSELPSAPAA